jgi:hypothetical protein
MKRLFLAALLYPFAALADSGEACIAAGLPGPSCHSAGDLASDPDGFLDSRGGGRSGRYVGVIPFTHQAAFFLSADKTLTSQISRSSTGRVHLYVGQPAIGDVAPIIDAGGAHFTLPASASPYVMTVNGYTYGTYGVWSYTNRLTAE